MFLLDCFHPYKRLVPSSLITHLCPVQACMGLGSFPLAARTLNPWLTPTPPSYPFLVSPPLKPQKYNQSLCFLFLTYLTSSLSVETHFSVATSADPTGSPTSCHRTPGRRRVPHSQTAPQLQPLTPPPHGSPRGSLGAVRSEPLGFISNVGGGVLRVFLRLHS